jgi:hypothetical protein
VGEVDRCDAEVAVGELALDDDQRDGLVRHLDRVSVAELIARSAAARPRAPRSVADPRGRRRSTTVAHA